MSNRESEGPIQVLGNSPQEINDALATITNRLDHLKGLRGRTEVWDRIRASDPTADQDVLTRGSLQTIAQVVFIAPPGEFLIQKPGQSLVEPYTAIRRRYNFTGGQAGTARLCVFGWGTESGAKNIRITNGVHTFSSLTWSGNSQTLMVTEPVAINVSVDLPLKFLCAVSSATESLVLNWVMLELGG